MTANSGRNLWIDYLRSAITILVVAHHSSLAYTSFASFDRQAYIRSTAPIVDSSRWVGLDIFENYNDIFFMFLMFFIGGLFIAKSVQSKGILHFVKDRIFRLFLPFLAGGTVLMLLAHFPSWLAAGHDSDIIAYIKDFFTTEGWPAGPPWFIAVLFAFNLLAAVLLTALRKPMQQLASRLDLLQNKPVLFFFLILFITWILYVPVAHNIGAGTWTGYGPFDFQLSRILAYSGYFFLGVLVGMSDFNNRLFTAESAIIRNWKSWLLLSLVLYTLITLNSELNWLRQLAENKIIPVFAAWMMYYTFYVACCTATCIAFISVFRAKITHSCTWWNSLSENAYMIYLVHYVFVLWLQYILLDSALPALVKFNIVWMVALGLSWGTAILLRRISYVKKYI